MLNGQGIHLVVIAMAEVIDSRGNDREGKEEADEGQVDCQPGRIGQLQGASVGVGSAAKDQMVKIHGGPSWPEKYPFDTKEATTVTFVMDQRVSFPVNTAFRSI